MQISEKLKERFEKAKSFCGLISLGTSTESGIPVFNGGSDSTIWKGMLLKIH